MVAPEDELRRICDFAGLAFEPGMVNYGDQPGAAVTTDRALGDPVTVAREQRPTTKSLAKWTGDLAGEPAKVDQCRRILASLLDEDLATWGYSRPQIEAELDAVDVGGAPRPRPRLTRYGLERKLLILLRRNIHHYALGRLVRRLRNACDVLLR